MHERHGEHFFGGDAGNVADGVQEAMRREGYG